MKRSIYILFLFLFLFLFESCAQEAKQGKTLTNTKVNSAPASSKLISEKQKIINPSGTTLEARILPPAKFKRSIENEKSFSEYLRHLVLKPHGSEVMYYNGSVKANHDIYVAVIDMEIGSKDLHQCADAVMRLRAEYLWKQKRYEDIHFNFTNGFRVDYSKWMEGKRIVVKGNTSYWVDRLAPSNTYNDFWSYMEVIFSYAGTLSLSKELIPVDLKDIKIGDVFIKGGSPGHAVLVIDIAENSISKEKIFLLAQSYMPAQETQILKNPNNLELSPWYSVSEIDDRLNTPEWSFSSKDLKRFEE